MKVNYFDLGLFNGLEIKMMIDILAELGITDYRAYGFEAHPTYSKECEARYRGNNRVKIDNVAIGSKRGASKLYLSSNSEGHSIYATKNNIIAGREVATNTIIFSEWLENNVPDFRDSFNILKVNIEGAEWDLLKDFDSKDLFKYFGVFCGSWGDVTKIKELESIIPEYNEILERNNIQTYRFTYYRPQFNSDMKGIVREALDKYIKK